MIGFILGCSLPLLAGRFGKFMPADAGTALASLFHKPCFHWKSKSSHYPEFRSKWIQLKLACLMWGLLLAGLYYAVDTLFPISGRIFVKMMIYLVLLLALVDWKTMLLPDILTVPLLIFGFAYAAFSRAISPEVSVTGAMFGYLLPTFAIFLVYPLIKGGFGGGDIKMLAALGAWLGFIGLNLTLFLSCFVFVIMSVVRRSKSGPYGPALAISALIVLFARAAEIGWLKPLFQLIQY